MTARKLAFLPFDEPLLPNDGGVIDSVSTVSSLMLFFQETVRVSQGVPHPRGYCTSDSLVPSDFTLSESCISILYSLSLLSEYKLSVNILHVSHIRTFVTVLLFIN